ncbi:MAG TPA: hypothetical protein PLE74_12180, partial [Candidatus Cloacimonadota bacterium]|nr:hypothetical protein [Candidatus Cloacimonadota bacterium]
NKKEKDGDATPQDYKKANDAQIEIEIKKAQTEKIYYNKLEKILSPEKISKLYEAENNFQNELLKQVEKRKYVVDVISYILQFRLLHHLNGILIYYE